MKIEYYSSKEVAEMLNLTVGTLQDWRKKRKGPKWIRVSQRKFSYPVISFNAWLKKNLFNKTNYGRITKKNINHIQG